MRTGQPGTQPLSIINFEMTVIEKLMITITVSEYISYLLVFYFLEICLFPTVL